jgi:hypothetical protein
MDIRYSVNQRDFKRYTTQEMRDEFLITGLYQPDQVTAVYSHVDRMVTLGCMPVIVLLIAVIYLTTRYKQGTSDGVGIALIFGGIALYSTISWSIKYAAWRKGQAEQKGN